MKLQAIIAAAGAGERLGMDEAKPFVLLKNKHLVLYALEVCEACDRIDSIIIAAALSSLEQMQSVVAQQGFKKVKHIIAGGKERTASVYNALAFIDSDTTHVMIHDGARPLITVDFVNNMINAAADKDALIAAVPVKPTIKQVDLTTLIVQKTLDRQFLWDIQTPQIFVKEVLIKAYEGDFSDATDDASLVERMGKEVKVFLGLEQNIKVTTAQDLFIAEKLLERAEGA